MRRREIETPDTRQKYREEMEGNHNPSRQLALDLTEEGAPRVSDDRGEDEMLGKELGKKENPAKNEQKR
jgi:hypothetical protein